MSEHKAAERRAERLAEERERNIRERRDELALVAAVVYRPDLSPKAAVDLAAELLHEAEQAAKRHFTPGYE